MPKFTPELRDAYLRLIAKGMKAGEAARSVGVSPQTVRNAVSADAAFAADLEEVRTFAREAVESVLYERALEGESWAVKTYLAAEDPDKYGTARSVSVSVRGELGGGDGLPLLERVRLMETELRGRRALLDGVVDAEIVEIGEGARSSAEPAPSPAGNPERP